MKRLSSSCILFLAWLVFPTPAIRADFVVGPFGSFGEGGQVNGQSLTFGTAGSVFELDAFINVGGQDLNGATPGTSRRLSTGPPDILTYTFAHSLSADLSALTLTYQFINVSGAALPDVQFLFFVDAEIDAATSFFDEFGTEEGILGLGPGDPHPDSWEIDEPGFVFGDIVTNLFSGLLDDTNSVPADSPEDVSLALGFRLGDLNPLDTAIIEILLSDDGSSIGSFALMHADPTVLDTLSLSGQATVTAIPEPSSQILFATGIAGWGVFLRRRRGPATPSRLI